MEPASPLKSGISRLELADLMLGRLEAEKGAIARRFSVEKARIGHFWVDDLLPADLASRLSRAFPKPETMKLKKTLREFKYIAAQMDRYDPILEEAVYAFQDPRIVEFVKQACDLSSAYPDDHLYAGGISLMGKGQYLNPHVDNSHDKDGARWRVLNLLYYVSEDWQLENGGNLELWPEGMKGKQITLHSKFNRLVVMVTHDQSWHSVSPIEVDAYRKCISNYYFSDQPVHADDSFHVTSFRGRPEDPLADLALQADALLRTGLRRILPKGIANKSHVYQKAQDDSATKID